MFNNHINNHHQNRKEQIWRNIDNSQTATNTVNTRFELNVQIHAIYIHVHSLIRALTQIHVCKLTYVDGKWNLTSSAAILMCDRAAHNFHAHNLWQLRLGINNHFHACNEVYLLLPQKKKYQFYWGAYPNYLLFLLPSVYRL